MVRGHTGTAQEWLACSDVDSMLELLRNTASDRQWRLFLCACGRRLLPLLASNHKDALRFLKKACPLIERYADGLATWPEIDKAIAVDAPNRMASHASRFAVHVAVEASCIKLAGNTRPMQHGKSSLIAHPASAGAAFARAAASHILAEDPEAPGKSQAGRKRVASAAEQQAQVHILRDIFGNPFRLRPSRECVQTWITFNDSCALHIAEAAYMEGNFDRLPILGDALEEANCTDDDLLVHCRKPSAHVKGCWVVDLLLGKS
jgi:hypothetical protein